MTSEKKRFLVVTIGDNTTGVLTSGFRGTPRARTTTIRVPKNNGQARQALILNVTTDDFCIQQNEIERQTDIEGDRIVRRQQWDGCRLESIRRDGDELAGTFSFSSYSEKYERQEVKSAQSES